MYRKLRDGPRHKKYQVGQEFRGYTLTQYLGSDKYQRSVWELTCNSCGIISVKHTGQFKTNVKIGCPCNPYRGNVKDLTGLKHYNITVKSYAGKGPAGTRWLCECVCGKEFEAVAYQINGRHTRSCGCMKNAPRPNRRNPDVAFNLVWGTYVGRAKRSNMGFDLTREEFRALTKSNCFYCAKPPSNKYKYHIDYVYSGLDRIDSSVGYIKTNVVACCKECNYMKLDSSREDFFSNVKRIYELHNLQSR